MSKYTFGTEEPKYKIGEKPIEFSDVIKVNTTISFAFNDISLNRNVLCFNNERINKKKYFEVIEYIKYLSEIKM